MCGVVSAKKRVGGGGVVKGGTCFTWDKLVVGEELIVYAFATSMSGNCSEPLGFLFGVVPDFVTLFVAAYADVTDEETRVLEIRVFLVV